MSKTKSATRTVSSGAKSKTQPVSTPAAVLPLGFVSLVEFAAFGLLCGVVFIAPQFFSEFWPATYNYLPQALFLALTACACVLLALRGNSQFSILNSQFSITARLLALFLGWCLLSVWRAAYLHDAILEIARIAGVVAWFYITRTLLESGEYFARRAMWLLMFVALGAAMVCVPAIFDFATTRNPRQFATFYNPNLFANYCALALPLCAAGVLALWRAARQRQFFIAPNAVLVLGAILIIVIGSGLVVTSSKGGYLAALCGLIVFALAIFKAQSTRVQEVLRARRGIVLAIGLSAILAGGILFSVMILPRLSANLENDHSTMFRFYTWKGTLKMAAARPILGHGAGSFPSAYTRYAETGYTRTAHQLWLQLAAEHGIPALLLLLAACGASTFAGLRALKTQNWIFAAGGLGALAAFFVHGLTDAGWSIISIATLLMAVLALLEAGGWRLEADKNSALSTQNSALNWFWLLAALPLALGSWLYQRAQAGEDLREESRRLMAAGAPSTAVEKARAATEADPFSARLWHNYAQALEATGQDTTNAYETIIKLQRTRALNYLYYAEYLGRRGGDKNKIERLYYTGVGFDPNDTEILLSYGQWQLKRGDLRGERDILHIAMLADKPFGKYPATPEMVDLNFARAYAILAEEDQSTAKKWIEKGLQVIAKARKWEPQRRQLEQATQGAIDYSREQTMDELEARFKALQEKLK